MRSDPPSIALEASLKASVVVPVRNRPDLLAATLASLVDQDIPAQDYEIVVCDDGSVDDIGNVLARFAGADACVRLERQPPIGPAAARNLGIRQSRAPIVIFVDSDVVVDRCLVSSLVGALAAQPQWQGAEAALLPSGKDTGLLWDAPASLEGGHYHTAAIAYRREALVAAGGFDETFKLPACEDVELALRVLARGAIGFVPEAKAWHPRRKVTARMHWRWRRHWRYETILAQRYGILAFPGRSCGPFPRLRVAFAAVVTLPGGRLLSALRASLRAPAEAGPAALYALLDVVCGLVVLPDILFGPVPARQDYLNGWTIARSRR